MLEIDCVNRPAGLKGNASRTAHRRSGGRQDTECSGTRFVFTHHGDGISVATRLYLQPRAPFMPFGLRGSPLEHQLPNKGGRPFSPCSALVG